MSCYDQIVCEFELPDHREFQNNEFQTKSLLCDHVFFKIAADGRLLELKRDYDFESEDPEKRYRKEIVGVYNFTGTVLFYDFVLPCPAEGWVEYKAEFKNGMLLAIELYEYRRGKEPEAGSILHQNLIVLYADASWTPRLVLAPSRAAAIEKLGAELKGSEIPVAGIVVDPRRNDD